MDQLSLPGLFGLSVASLSIALAIAMAGAVVLTRFRVFRGCLSPEHGRYFPFLSFGVGVVCFTLVLYALAVLQLLERRVLIALLGSCLVAFLVLPDLRVPLWNGARLVFAAFRRGALVERVFVLLLLFAFGRFFVSGLTISATPSFDADTATTYLNAAKLYSQYRSIIDVGNLIGNEGRNAFLLPAVGISLEGSLLAQQLLFLVYFAGVALLFAFMARHAGIVIAALAIFVLLGMNLQLDTLVGTAKREGMLFAFGVLALVTFHLALSAQPAADRGFLLVSGASTGFLAGASLFYLSLVPVYGAALLYDWRTRSKSGAEGSDMSAVLLWCVAAGVSASPTYLYSVALFGNPFYPLLGNIFGNGVGGSVGPGTFAYDYLREIRHLHSINDIQTFISVPWLLLSDPPPMLQASSERVFGTLWLVTFALLPLTLWRAYRDPAEPGRRFLVGFCVFGYGCMYVFWAFSQAVLRYFVGAFPFLLVLAAYSALALGGLWKGSRPHTPGREAVCWMAGAVALALLAAVHGAETYWYAKERMRWVLETRTVDSLLSSRFKYQLRNGGISNFGDAIVWVRYHARPGDKVLSFITGSFYFGRDTVVFSGNGASTLPSKHGLPKGLSKFADDDELHRVLLQNGFKLVVIHPKYLYLSEQERPVIDGWLKNRKPEAEVDGVLIYRL